MTSHPQSQPDIEDEVLDLLRICFDEKTRAALTWTSWKDGIDITRVGSDTMRFVDLVMKRLAPQEPRT